MRLLITSFLFCFFLCSYAQNTLELMEYNPDRSYTQSFIDSLCFDSASGESKGRVRLSIFKKVLENDANLKGWIYYYGGMSNIVVKENKLDSAIYFADKGIQHFTDLNTKRDLDEHLLMLCYRIKGLALARKKQYEQSLVFNQKALDLAKVYPYKWNSFVLVGMGETHGSIGNDSIALGYFLETIKDSLYMTLPRSAISTTNRIGEVYSRLGNVRESKRYFRKSLKLAKTHNLKNNLDAIYGNLGLFFVEESVKDSAVFYFKKAMKYSKKEGEYFSPNYLGYSAYYEAYILIDEGRYDEAIKILKGVIDEYTAESAIYDGTMELMVFAYRSLSEAYREKGMFDEADVAFVQSNKVVQVFYENRLEERVTDLEFKYQTKEKDASIGQLENTAKIQGTILKQRNAINWILGGLLIALGGVGVLFFKHRQQKNTLKATNLEQRLLRSQLNPHFLFNALNTASSLAHQKSEKTTTYISKLGGLLRSVLENSREEFISLKEELETITAYLELQSDFSKKFNYEIVVSNSLDQEETLIPPMFIQPIIENAIQHGFKGKEDEIIKIGIGKNTKDNTLEVLIENSGVPYSESIQKTEGELHNSISGSILKERLAIYAKRFKTNSYYKIGDLVGSEKKGTQVSLFLPLVLDE